MHSIDWIVLIGTLLTIVVIGIFKSRKKKGFLKGVDTPWWAIGLSIMATQASAITFLSTPGQAYDDGMRFVQFYLGMPIAMVILCVFVLPLYYKLKVYTAYEFLEQRFDRKTRILTAVLFLIQRGLAAGLTIYAPAIILSSILGWDLTITNGVIGGLVILYVYFGGTEAVTQTQKQQMAVIFGGIFIAFYILLQKLPQSVPFADALRVAGSTGKLDILNFNFDLNDRYTFWTGMIASVFLFLSYFGTDQSQVQRYLSGRTLKESRYGLLFNGFLKVPMQFFILLIGVMVFVFFQFNKTPVHFNQSNIDLIETSAYSDELATLQNSYDALWEEKEQLLLSSDLKEIAPSTSVRLNELLTQEQSIRSQTKEIIKNIDPQADTEDNDYVFIYFVLNYLPVGIIGLLLAVIFSAAMSSTASEINALATTTVIDIYKTSFKPDADEAHYVQAGKAFTLVWGALAVFFAIQANLFENLIEAVNIIGSLFYGPILGIFAVAFFLKKVNAQSVFIAAIIAELIVLFIYFATERGWQLPLIGTIQVAYLWLNLIGCMLVVALSAVLPHKKRAE